MPGTPCALVPSPSSEATKLKAREDREHDLLFNRSNVGLILCIQNGVVMFRSVRVQVGGGF